MAKFNWPTFLDRHRIAYSTRGPNTPTGAVSIHCPMCGDGDPSDHMVLWPNGGWRCWRNYQHGGGNAAWLVKVLIGCSLQEAQRITASENVPTRDALAAALLIAQTTPEQLAAQRQATAQQGLELPRGFRPFREEWACQPYLTYLSKRGFNQDPVHLYRAYGLHYCTRGPFGGRIIFPVVHKGNLISWTGRTIYPAEQLRYKSLSPNLESANRAGLEPALAPINHHLLWHDHTAKGTHDKQLVLVEGPLDALKVNLLGRPNVLATCWTGSEPTRQQIELLHGLAPRFGRCWVISDSDMWQKAEHIAGKLRALGFTAAKLPQGIGDPAELRTRAQLLSLLS